MNPQDNSTTENEPEHQEEKWTWTPMENEWGAMRLWSYDEPWPKVGENITVYRQDGSESQAKIRKVDGPTAYRNGQIRMFCRVIDSRPYDPVPSPSKRD